MAEATLRQQIHERVNSLPEDKLSAVMSIISSITDDGFERNLEVIECELMSEEVMLRELNTPEEDKIWQHLNDGT